MALDKHNRLLHAIGCPKFEGIPDMLCTCGYESDIQRGEQVTNQRMLQLGERLMTRQMEVMTAIGRERKFQDDKHGHPDKNPHTIGAWLLIMEDELAEAKKACIKGGEGRDNVINEIVQLAATCVACLEQHGINPIPGRTV